ncbi:hypothetical protein PR202_gb08550 [Eleusine coracana subsp. coracana]|uniref:Uncharacterized protein n=1 Tax=Eleusine coracana subsp. coracana TaxID=191504 RepID=A0AAV5EEZ5_ELECO|nr:hypothetical protein PR202_gb08550 [Eleusine coracana subsp. coracana]
MAPPRRSPAAPKVSGNHLCSSLFNSSPISSRPLLIDLLLPSTAPQPAGRRRACSSRPRTTATTAPSTVRHQLHTDHVSVPGHVALILVVSSVAGLARALDKGRGRLRETVEAVTLEDEGMKGVGVLHLAASNRKQKMCAYLVEGVRMNVDAVDDAGRTPLIHAIFGEHVDIVKYLLDHGANKDNVDRNGFTPLHSAAGLGSLSMIICLFCICSFVHSTDLLCGLFYLSRCRETVELLLARGAYTDPVTCCGTPLHIAATEGKYHTTRYYWTTMQINKIAELKSQGNEAVGRKNFLSAAEFYSMDYKGAGSALMHALRLDPANAEIMDGLCPSRGGGLLRPTSHSIAPPHPAPARSGRCPPPVPAPLRPEQELLLEAASDGDLVLFKRVAKLLDARRGRITEAVEAVVECTAGALHLVAGQGELAMCRYLVEELRVDVNAIHEYGKYLHHLESH